MVIETEGHNDDGCSPGSDSSETATFEWSGRLDLNQRPLAPQASALPGCATPRCESIAVMPPRLGNVKVSARRTTSAELLLAPARALGTLPGVGGASLQFRSGVERAL